MSARIGLLLVNLGTPDAPTPAAVRRYLREFLSDPRVLDIPPLRRFLLLELLILPRRPKVAAAAYKKIWLDGGSPLLVHGRALAAKVQHLVGSDVQVELAMRYGTPSIASALAAFARAGVERVVLLPLFPQYSAASTGSAIARVLTLAAERWDPTYFDVVRPFYSHPAYLEARAEVVAPFLARGLPERVIFSFHGLPERQIRRSDPTGAHCLASNDCCARLDAAASTCYRAQCLASARLLRERLGIPEERVIVAFQSRLGRTPWLRPYTDEILVEEARRGTKNALILSPGFVTDCLETLEELGMRGVEAWREHGGETLTVVPALNASDRFAQALVRIAADSSTAFAAAVRLPSAGAAALGLPALAAT
jgi:ferrochelatase